jgi:hypothetical protein
MLRRRFHATGRFRPGMGVVVGRRGGFFKKLFKGVAKVAKFVAPAVVAVAKTAASHTVVGKVLSTVAKVKKRTAVGVAAKAYAAAKRLPDYGGEKEARSQGLGRFKGIPAAKRRKMPLRKRKAKGKAKRKGGGTAKQRAARARFAAAARKGRIRKGAKL